MKDDDGTVHHDRQEMADVFGDFYAALYKSRPSENLYLAAGADDIPFAPFSLEELQEQLTKLKHGKGRDSFRIAAEFLKYGGN